MPYTVKKVDIWAGEVEDRPGGLANKLEPLAAAGGNFEFAVARRDQPGSGLIFIEPVRGTKVTKAAANTGFKKGVDVGAVKVTGPDKAGLGATVTRACGDIGVSIRAVTAMTFGKQSAMYIILDTADDAAKAVKVISKALNKK